MARSLVTQRLALIALVTSASACGSSGPQPDASGVWIDALLPFTGGLAAGAANYERAMILATEAVNAEGGLSRGELKLRVQDTHSDVRRSTIAASYAIGDDTSALIGPDDPNSITSMARLVEASGIVQMLPGITAPPIAARDDNYWFRILPPAHVTGCAWAQRLYEDSQKRIVILHEDDEFSRNLSAGVVKVFNEMPEVGQEVLSVVAFDPARADYAALLRSVYAQAPDAVVLIAGAQVGAALVNDWSGPSAMSLKWYLGPSMNTQEFVINTLPGQLEGMTGIAAAIPEGTSAPFAAAYSRRWAGDYPLIGAYAYYDAVAILALAIQSAAHAASGPPSRQEIRDHIARVSQPPGKTVPWDQIGTGLSLLEAGTEINYQGASGQVDLASAGAIDASISLFRFWKIVDDEIVSTEWGSCVWLAE